MNPVLSKVDLQSRSLDAVWHPCTQMARAQKLPPLPIVRGEGAWLYDEQGRRYFDACSSWWVNLFGHSDAGLISAIKQQLDTLPHVMLAGCTHEPAVRLAERLSALRAAPWATAFLPATGPAPWRSRSSRASTAGATAAAVKSASSSADRKSVV